VEGIKDDLELLAIARDDFVQSVNLHRSAGRHFRLEVPCVVETTVFKLAPFNALVAGVAGPVTYDDDGIAMHDIDWAYFDDIYNRAVQAAQETQRAAEVVELEEGGNAQPTTTDSNPLVDAVPDQRLQKVDEEDA
jgi:hypothetical protein